MSEPSDWAKRKAAVLTEWQACYEPAWLRDEIAAALEEAAQRERGACHRTVERWSTNLACAIAERGPMIFAPDSQRGAA